MARAFLLMLSGCLLLTAACSDDGNDSSGTSTTTTTKTDSSCTGTSGNVSGTVLLDKYDGNGLAPAGDTEFQFEPSVGGSPFVVRSEPDGSYFAPLPAGTYRVGGSPGQCPPYNPPLDVVVEACADLTVDIPLELCLGGSGGSGGSGG